MRCTCRIVLGLPLLNLVWLNAVSTLQPCLTPGNADGYCIPIRECSWFTQKLDTYPALNTLPRGFVNIVQSSKCTVKNAEGLHICCKAVYVPTISNNTRSTRSIPINSTRNSFHTQTTFTDYMSSLSPKGIELLNCNFPKSISKRIVAHGIAAYLAEFPFMALLRYDAPDHPFQCGGSLITTKYVLTAAHCVRTQLDLIGVRLGELDITTDPDCQEEGQLRQCAPSVEDFGIAKTIVHPDYRKYHKVNDVALIKLNAVVQYKGTASDILQFAFVSHQELAVCRNLFQLDSINENTICAGGTNNVDSCKGDSGGPLFRKVAEQYVQYGIVSFGSIKCGVDHSYPGIYANVLQYMPWITSQLD